MTFDDSLFTTTGATPPCWWRATKHRKRRWLCNCANWPTSWNCFATRWCPIICVPICTNWPGPSPPLPATAGCWAVPWKTDAFYCAKPVPSPCARVWICWALKHRCGCRRVVQVYTGTDEYCSQRGTGRWRRNVNTHYTTKYKKYNRYKYKWGDGKKYTIQNYREQGVHK